MSFGARAWAADGTLLMDENSFTMRVVLSATVMFANTGKTSQDFGVPGCTSSNSIAVVIPIGTYNETTAFQFETEMVDNIARIYNYTRTFDASLGASGTMRLLVIRFA